MYDVRNGVLSPVPEYMYIYFLQELKTLSESEKVLKEEQDKKQAKSTNILATAKNKLAQMKKEIDQTNAENVKLKQDIQKLEQASGTDMFTPKLTDDLLK